MSLAVSRFAVYRFVVESKTNNPNIEQRPPVNYQTLPEPVSEAEAGEIIRLCIGLRI